MKSFYLDLQIITIALLYISISIGVMGLQDGLATGSKEIKKAKEPLSKGLLYYKIMH